MDMKITFQPAQEGERRVQRLRSQDRPAERVRRRQTRAPPFELFLASLGACAGFYVSPSASNAGHRHDGNRAGARTWIGIPRPTLVAQGVGIEIVPGPLLSRENTGPPWSRRPVVHREEAPAAAPPVQHFRRQPLIHSLSRHRRPR